MILGWRYYLKSDSPRVILRKTLFYGGSTNTDLDIQENNGLRVAMWVKIHNILIIDIVKLSQQV